MDRQTYDQIDRIEEKLDYIINIFEEEEEKEEENKKVEVKNDINQ